MVAEGIQSILESYDDLEVRATLTTGAEAVAYLKSNDVGRRADGPQHAEHWRFDGNRDGAGE